MLDARPVRVSSVAGDRSICGTRRVPVGAFSRWPWRLQRRWCRVELGLGGGLLAAGNLECSLKLNRVVGARVWTIGRLVRQNAHTYPLSERLVCPLNGISDTGIRKRSVAQLGSGFFHGLVSLVPRGIRIQGNAPSNDFTRAPATKHALAARQRREPDREKAYESFRLAEHCNVVVLGKRRTTREGAVRR